VPDNIDDVNGSEDISGLFLKKYHELYNSVSYNQSEMEDFKRCINDMVSEHCAPGVCTDTTHNITVSDVCENIMLMKGSKHGGNTGHYSDHITNQDFMLLVCKPNTKCTMGKYLLQ
jgi:hypothetical protein